MEAHFWHERWRIGKIGFHQETVAPCLRKYWSNLTLPHGSRVFVPLCGKSLDMLWLRNYGNNVVGAELSEIAIESFCMENGILTRRGEINSFAEYEAAGLRLLCGDFFRLTASTLAPCSFVYDRAALISWAPELRARYVEHLTDLTLPGCQTLLITVEYQQSEIAGPPFSVDAPIVHQLYSAHHKIRLLERKDILATDRRMLERGVTQLHEACYQLTRI